MSRILPLSAETISRVHSSKNITSLQGVVLSLLENSLDAGSNKIEVTVDFRRGGCKVEDNGSGIPPREFLENGGLGKMYHTSKHTGLSPEEFHGSRGTYLASLSALSLLSITSCHLDTDDQALLTIHHGKVVARRTQILAADEIVACSSHGTLVTVRDLFGNMPVRVKQRALTAVEKNENEKLWFELKVGIVALLTAWRKPCAVRVLNAETGKKVFQLGGGHPTVGFDLTRRSLDKLAGRNTSFSLEDVVPILSRAGLAPTESRAKWIPVSTSTPRLSVKGTICLDPVPTKQCQFISVGVRPCLSASGNGDLYDAVNKVFNSSSFGAVDVEGDIDDAEKDRRLRDRRFKQGGFTRKQLHGRKGVDRWPMFVLQVKFAHTTSSPTVEPENISDSSLKAVVDVLEATITQWLATNHFRPRKLKSSKEQDPQPSTEHALLSASETRNIRTPVGRQPDISQSATTSKKRKYVDILGKSHVIEQTRGADAVTRRDYFNSWSRIKSGRDSFYDEMMVIQKPATAPAGQTGSKGENGTVESRLALNLPTLEAGELNSVEPGASKASVNAHDVPSSEDFGSFDDHEVLAIVGSSEVAAPDSFPAKIDTGNEPGTLLEDGEPSDDAVMHWIDPITKKSFRVNARTGVVLPSRPKSAIPHANEESGRELEPRGVAAINTTFSSAGNSLSLRKRKQSINVDQPMWLPGFLKQWNNPVFAQQDEERIPATSSSLFDVNAIGAEHKKCRHATQVSSFTELATTVSSNLSKAQLRNAKVIRQVDHKYILCTTKATLDSAGEILILIDQHAASERVILEALLDELCSPAEDAAEQSQSKIKTVRLEKSLHFDISEAEYRLFAVHQAHFANWGISYKLNEKDEVLDPSQVRAAKRVYTIIVQHLPPGIAERCVLMPRLLIELLRTEIWDAATSAKRPKALLHPDPESDTSSEDPVWLKRLGSCPKGIIDMLNSRACRSAIMFNDELSIAQCQQLLVDLSKCAFPFMCAHGRVSMVPLIETGRSLRSEVESALSESNGMPSGSFTNAFSEWMGIRSVDKTAQTNED